DVTWTLSEHPGAGGGFALLVTGAAAAAGVAVGVVDAADRTDMGTEPARATLTPTGVPVTVAFAGDLTISGSQAQPAAVVPAAGARAVLSSRHLLLPGGFGLSLPTAEIPLGASGPQPSALEVIVPAELPIVGGLVLPVDLAAAAAGTDI